MVLNSSNSAFYMTPVVLTSPQANGPGGNPIVPTPATPSTFPKMIIAIVIISVMLWFVSTMWSEDAAKWLAVISVGAIITYYETNGNHQFSNELKSLFGQ